MKKPKKQPENELMAGLDSTLPDLAALTPEVVGDNLPIRDKFGMETCVFSARVTSGKVITFDARKVKIAALTIGRLPTENESVHMVCGGEFCGFDLIPAILTLSGAQQFGRMYLSTLGFSKENLAQFATMFRARQIQPKLLKVLCGDFFRRADAGIWADGRLLAKEWGFEFKSFRNHTKLILAEVGGAKYVVESSANLRSCHNIELFTLRRSAELFDFHAGWLESCLKFAKE